jgi:hypothetical protein
LHSYLLEHDRDRDDQASVEIVPRQEVVPLPGVLAYTSVGQFGGIAVMSHGPAFGYGHEGLFMTRRSRFLLRYGLDNDS